MKTRHLILSLSILAVGTTAGIAYATGGKQGMPCPMQGGGGPGKHQGPGGGMSQEMRQARIDGRLADLKADLDLEAGQAEAWEAFAQRLRGVAAGHEPGAGRPQGEDMLQARIDRMEAKLARMKGIAEAREALMAALTEEQAERLRGFPGGCR